MCRLPVFINMIEVMSYSNLQLHDMVITNVSKKERKGELPAKLSKTPMESCSHGCSFEP